MLILLPPSETKAERTRGRPTNELTLSFAELRATRREVAQALHTVSLRPDAADLLGVSPRLAPDIARNTRLDIAPAMPVSRLYTGVLYDALGYATLDAAARRHANRWLLVISALYGALRFTDAVAPYRLSMAVNLDGLGPLAAHWRGPLATVLPQAARGMIVDCRSSSYAAAWRPGPALARRWVQIHVPGATHLAKHTRGLVARQLCEAGVDAKSPRALEEVVSRRFATALTPPQRPGRPWVLATSTR